MKTQTVAAMNSGKYLLLAAACSLLAGTAYAQEKGDEAKEQPKQHPLVPAIRIATNSLEQVKKLGDYQAQLIKREVIKGKPVKQTMRIKVRHKPFSVYLFFHEPAQGREVIYVDGKNDGNLLAHETGAIGWLGTLKYKPTHPTVMADNRYPITRIGIEKMTQAIIDQWKLEAKYLGTEVKYYKNAKVGDLQCLAIETTHPEPRKQFKFKTTRLWIDKKTNMPIRAEQFAFPKKKGDKAVLVEQYTYLSLKPNISLTDKDFSTDNPKYKF